MQTLGKTIRSIAAQKRNWERLIEGARLAGMLQPQAAASDRLTEVRSFGSNPGALRMFTYVPADLPAEGRALVVVLHGCTQTAAAYDYGAGWSTLADRFGFALLLPEQQTANNPQRCFNWFLPGDTTRDRGEALSIRQMVDAMVADHGIDPGRIFVTGLSAGGAMTAVMLATYPDVFVAGAIVAGLPYGAAANVQEALDSMFQGRTRSGAEWGDLVRRASPHRGPWPRVSVWHGAADQTVRPVNALEIVKQWTNVHGLPPPPSAEETRDGYPRQVWRGPGGAEVIEAYTIPGMAHGTPVAAGPGENQAGAPGPFLLEVGISSAYHIAKFWGLMEAGARKREPARAVPQAEPAPPLQPAAPPEAVTARPRTAPRPRPFAAGDIITKALKAAGLMR